MSGCLPLAGEAAVLGPWIILVPEDFVRTELDAGDLVQVMPGCEPAHISYKPYILIISNSPKDTIVH